MAAFLSDTYQLNGGGQRSFVRVFINKDGMIP